MNQFSYLLVLLTFTCNAQTHTIPFTLNKQSNICIKARIDNSDTLVLMYHTSATDVILTHEAIKNKILINLASSDTIQTWGGAAVSENSAGHTFSLGKLSWKNITVFSDINSGVDTDGKFGSDLFKGKIIMIDYDKQLLTVFEKLPKRLKKYTRLPIKIDRGSIFIKGSLISRSTN